jgi:hypothetical protein
MEEQNVNGEDTAQEEEALEKLTQFAWGYIRDMVEGLTYLHMHRLSHGDIKPLSELLCLHSCLATMLCMHGVSCHTRRCDLCCGQPPSAALQPQHYSPLSCLPPADLFLCTGGQLQIGDFDCLALHPET